LSKKVVVRTAQEGATAAARRVLAAVSSATSAPTAEADGILLQRNEFIHVFFGVGGTDPVFSVVVWWYSAISGLWHRGESFNVNSNDLNTIEVQGLSRMYLQVVSVSGTTPTLDAWVGLVVPV
jgi:hypothetical protein